MHEEDIKYLTETPEPNLPKLKITIIYKVLKPGTGGSYGHEKVTGPVILEFLYNFVSF